MDDKIKVCRMVGYDELTKDERIDLASTTNDRNLQFLLSEDDLPEVRARLARNLAVSEFFIYERLINDSSEEVKNALKMRYKRKHLNDKHWIVCKFSRILFGKLPTFDKLEQRQVLSALIYLSVIESDSHLDCDFAKFGEYSPYSCELNYCMRTMSNIFMIFPEMIEELESKYKFAENVQQKMDDFWQNINKQKPNGISLETWISSIAYVHLLTYDNSLIDLTNADKIDKLAYEFVIQHFK